MKHGIQLVFANGRTICLTGETCKPTEVVVTCTCHGHPNNSGYTAYIGPGQPVSEAWRRYNVAAYHQEPETFVNDKQMTLIYGLYQ